MNNTARRGNGRLASGALRRVSVVTALFAMFLVPLTQPLCAQGPSYSVVYSFQCEPDGQWPSRDLIADSAGNLYGTTQNGGTSGGGTVFKVSVDGTETVLHAFAVQPDGAEPAAGLVMDSAGNLYGTTFYGGARENGTVFEISSSGDESILYSFTGGKDEGKPMASLLLDPEDNLYGTTTGYCCTGYQGTVFRLSPSGKIAELHTFAGPPNDGALPFSGLIHDSAGNLYGTTTEGGLYGLGTVFELSKAGTETILYNFTGFADGADPSANLLRDSAGNLYDTAYGGGSTTGACPLYGCGTVFKLSPSGEVTGLYSFMGGADGANPVSDLLMDPKGNLYGTTPAGGSSPSACSTEDYPGCGVVFELTAAGKEKVLHTFTGFPNDGAFPYGGLVRVGNYLYGTTNVGGAYNCGTVYRVAP
ncbi:MAG TPA: choice-of-anchor tandem repeat GloVer-containing protein [Terriglobia bacterium]|nr:choice-of-anchor tandem repeat GloVer-containing protein [Terriglobia bacterium]